jgi:hypothetical protein
MAIVFSKHTLGADYLVAEFAKIFNFFFRVTATEDLCLLLLTLHARKKGRVLLLLLHHPVLIFLCMGLHLLLLP